MAWTGARPTPQTMGLNAASAPRRPQKRISAARMSGRAPPAASQAWVPRAAASSGVSPDVHPTGLDGECPNCHFYRGAW
jgi:hypothetical protein